MISELQQFQYSVALPLFDSVIQHILNSVRRVRVPVLSIQSPHNAKNNLFAIQNLSGYLLPPTRMPPIAGLQLFAK